MQTIIVTNQQEEWKCVEQYVPVISTEEYLSGEVYSNTEYVRVINLNKDYTYQSLGYYVSLLAAARKHKILPSIVTIQDLKNPMLAKIISFEIHADIQQHLNSIKSKEFVLSIYFGKNIAQKYDRLCQQIHKLFPAPLIRVHFRFSKKWHITTIMPIAITDVPLEHRAHLIEFAQAYFNKKRFHTAKLSKKPYDMAILINPDEKSPPSNKRAIKNFIDAAEDVGFNVDVVVKEDLKNVTEYDALFIRETTSVNHHTYRLARKAAAEGLIVIDDPESILKCTNKVYLAELLQKHKVDVPRTYIINKKNKQQLIKQIPYPFVLKLPDSSFSKGVIKVANEEAFCDALENFFEASELLLAQEYMPTDYDWRIGVIDGLPLYACRYYMAKNHWQIYDWQGGGRYGKTEAIPLEEVPPSIMRVALKAARLIGNGLYGLDIKEKDNIPYVIEINDNPSIEAGYDDEVLGEKVYETIMRSFIQRVKSRHG